jgi:hypothetical protein
LPDIRGAFSAIDGACELSSTRPKTEAEWGNLLRSNGLRPIGRVGLNEKWQRNGADGSIVAYATLLDDGAYYFLHFFPSQPETVAPSILDWLLKSSPFTNVIEGDRLEIKRDVAVQLAAGGSARYTTVVVSASTAKIVRVEVSHVWRLR